MEEEKRVNEGRQRGEEKDNVKEEKEDSVNDKRYEGRDVG